MPVSESAMLRAARGLAFASAVSILFSIAVCHILMALALAALLFSEARLKLPPIWLPIAVFLGGTLLSLAFSDDPAAGLPQVRRIYVFLELLLVYSLLDHPKTIRRLFYCWFGIGALAALKGVIQFNGKYRQSLLLGRNFYDYYVSERITGFMSHWMTFGGQMMFVLLMLAAYLLFASDARKRGFAWLLLCGALISSAIVLGFTRTIWAGSAAGVFYIGWAWKRWYALLLPVALLMMIAVAPASVRTRFTSILKPQRGIDSNEFRRVCWITGWEMIKAHPILGLGPERVKGRFEEFVPAAVPRPLPEGWYGHLHNIYIHYAAERGVPVMLVVIWLFLKILYDFGRGLFRMAPGPSDAKFVLIGAASVVLATMTAGVFEHNLGDSEILTMFLIVVACGYCSLRFEEPAIAG